VATSVFLFTWRPLKVGSNENGEYANNDSDGYQHSSHVRGLRRGTVRISLHPIGLDDEMRGIRQTKECLQLGIIGQFFGAPVDEVAGVEGNAEKIGGDETELRGADANDADDGAINGGDDPALPEFLADEHGGENGQHAGEIIESDDVEHV
jgi:hypothetical protein